MKWYRFEEIRGSISCAEVARHFGLKQTARDRWESPHSKSGKSTALALSADRWYDHHGNGKQGGGCIELWAYLQGTDIYQASSEMGLHLGLSPMKIRGPRRKLEATYDYRALDGTIVHRKLKWRYEDGRKSYTQLSPNPESPGEFVDGLNGVETILYRLADWHHQPAVLIVGGEKDADTGNDRLQLPTTTHSEGEGQWQARYNPQFAEKRVVIIEDNDAAGRAHGVKVALGLRDHATSVKVVGLPGLPEKGDLSDWVDAGGTRDQLAEIISATPEVDWATLGSERVEDDLLQTKVAAKRANQTPFSNYTLVKVQDASGDERKAKTVKEPRPLLPMVTELKERFCGAPYVINGILFDHDHDTQRIQMIRQQSELFSWVSRKSGRNYAWYSKGESFVTRQEFFDALTAECRTYDSITMAPHYPPRDDTYYLTRELPPPDPECDALEQFVGFFGLNGPDDEILFKAYLATLIYFVPGGSKPVFVFDSDSGQSSGKTRTAELPCMILGGPDAPSAIPARVSYNLDHADNADRIVRRLLSESGRQCRMVLLDNVDRSSFQSAALANLVTAPTLSGMAPYGRGETTRVNDLTYVITVNGASLSRDIASRSLVIKARKQPLPNEWLLEMRRFATANWKQICSDLIGLLARGVEWGEDLPVSTRFEEWERTVLRAVSCDPDTYSRVIKSQIERREEADHEIQDAETWATYVRDRLIDKDIDPERHVTFIWSELMAQWSQEALPGLGGKGGRFWKRPVSNWIAAGMLSGFSLKPAKIRHQSGRRYGIWCGPPEALSPHGPSGLHDFTLSVTNHGEVEKWRE